MFAPYWVMNTPRPQGNVGWGAPSVPIPFQPRPMIPMPMHHHQIAHPRMRCQTVKPLPTTTVYPRQQLMESLRQEKSDSDLGNLDGVLNFNLSNILPPNFGFGETQQKKATVVKKRGPNNAVNGARTVTSVFQVKNETPSDTKVEEKDGVRPEDEAGSPKPLVIDTIVPTDQVRPPYSYSELIDLALRSEGEMTVRELYQWIIDHFDYYKNAEPAKWQPSVRHTLTISASFTKIKKVRGGNLWGHASARDQALARQQKNHWKKQKIAEYVKTSKCVRKRKDGRSNTSSVTSPDLNHQDLNPHSLSYLQSLCREQEMEGVLEVTEEVVSEPALGVSAVSVKSSGNRSKSSSTRSTPAKKVRKNVVQSDKAVPEVTKTQTRTGRTTNKLNYKLFSRKGCMQQSSSTSAKNLKSHIDINVKEEPDYTSEEEDDEEEEEEAAFHTRHRPTHSHASGSAPQNPSSVNMISPQVSPAGICHKMFQAIANVTMSDLEGNSGKTYSAGSDQIGTPAHLVVSDLQDFEPTESTESILASTSALTSFASISEAAMILSSLEASPRPRIPGPAEADRMVYAIKMRMEEKVNKEDPENPIPQPLESNTQKCALEEAAQTPRGTVIVTTAAMVLKSEDMGEESSEEITEVVFEVEEEGSSCTDPETSMDETVEIVMTIIESSSTQVPLRSVNSDMMPGSPACQPQTSSPVVPQGCLPSPKNSPIVSHTSPLVTKHHASPMPAGLNSLGVPNPRVLCTPPLSPDELNSKPDHLLMSNLLSPQSQAMRSTLNPQMVNPSSPLAPIRLPMLCPQRPPPPALTSYRCLRPGGLPSAAQGHPNLPYTMSHTSRPQYANPGWAMPGVHAVYMDWEESNGPHLLHTDVQLMDTWRKKPVCKKCRAHPPGSSQGNMQHPCKQHGKNQPRNEMGSPVGMPRFMGPGSRMPSPVFNYCHGYRPVTHTPVHYPLHPFVMAPSPVRPEQTTQAFMPVDKGLLGKPTTTTPHLSPASTSGMAGALSAPAPGAPGGEPALYAIKKDPSPTPMVGADIC